MIYATLQPTDSAALQANTYALVARGDVHPLLIESLWLTWSNLQPAPPQTMVFTDDRAPIEWLTNNLILNFLLESGTEVIRQ
jgi:hypothetical protein